MKGRRSVVRKLCTVLLTVMLTLFVVTLGTLAKETYTIGVSMSQLGGGPGWAIIGKAVRSGIEKAGHKPVILDAQGLVNKQIADIEDLIAKKVDLIVINPIDSSSVVPATLEAKKKRIPVFAVDIDVGEGGYSLTTVIANNRLLGQLVGWHLASLFNKPDVQGVIISGYQGAICSKNRREGFLFGFHENQLQRFNRTGLKIIYHGYGDYSYEPALRMMEDVIVRTGGKFDFVFAENDAMAIAAVKALEEAGITHVKVGGVDGQKEMYELIISGKAHATGRQNLWELGEKTAETALRILAGEHVPSPVYVESVLVNKDNVRKYYDPKAEF